MNKLVKNGISAYRIFLKNKLAMAIMMLVSGIMMLIAGIKGTGNDTVMMPLGITTAGAIFTFWGFYRLGYLKSNLEKALAPEDKKSGRASITLQILETSVYLLVMFVGIFLLINQGFTNQVLNLMAGFFTTLNGAFGISFIIKNRGHRDFRFYLRTILTVFELVFGIYFIIASYSIEMGWFIAMGLLTTVAGGLEVATTFNHDSLVGAMQDGKDIVNIFKEK